MKKLVFVLALLYAGVAHAGEIYTKSVTAQASTVVASAFAANRDQIPVLEFISILATAASSDVVIYAGDNSNTLYDHSAAKSAAATTFDVVSCTGFDDGDLVVIQWGGGTIEADIMASCNDTTDQMTITAGLTNAITSTQAAANRITVYEMQSIWSLANVGTSRVQFNGTIVAGTEDYPMAVSMIGAGAIEVATVEYK